MKSLKDYNEEKLNRHRELVKKVNQVYLNGISCSECGKELIDSRPGTILPSYPAQKNVHCSSCKFVGHAYA